MIGTLAFSNVKIGEIPLGCAILTVSDKLQVHLLLKVNPKYIFKK